MPPPRTKPRKKRVRKRNPSHNMDFSNVKFDLNLNLNFVTTSGGYFDGILQDLAANQNRIRLDKLIEARRNKIASISPVIADIHRRTVRVEKNLLAGEKEFHTKRGKYLPKNSQYHIHYTKDLKAYYMTGGEHSLQTQIIYRSNPQESDFDYYNTLNKQSTLKLESKVTLPTEEDYDVGRMIRYFAKKTNESSSPAFEISADDFETSPLYDYVSLLWYIRGNKIRVNKMNRREVLVARETLPNIEKLLPNYQYFRSSATVTSKQDIINRLGITGEQTPETQDSTTTTTQPTTTATTTTVSTTTTISGGGNTGGNGGYGN